MVPSPSPPEVHVSGSAVPYRPFTPNLPGPVADLPLTLPLQSTVPVSPFELCVPELGELDSPGAMSLSNLKLHGVCSLAWAGPVPANGNSEMVARSPTITFCLMSGSSLVVGRVTRH